MMANHAGPLGSPLILPSVDISDQIPAHALMPEHSSGKGELGGRPFDYLVIRKTLEIDHTLYSQRYNRQDVLSII